VAIKPGPHKWSLTCNSCGANLHELATLRELAEAVRPVCADMDRPKRDMTSIQNEQQLYAAFKQWRKIRSKQ